MNWDKAKIIEWLTFSEKIKIGDCSAWLETAYPKFAMVWMLFNSLYSQDLKNKYDSTQIRNFIQNNDTLHKQLINTSEEYKNQVENLKNLLEEKELKSLTRNKSSITRRNYPIKLEEPKEFDQVIDIIYTVRNNLFHGGKVQTDNERDSKLCFYSYNILKIFIEEYIENSGGIV